MRILTSAILAIGFVGIAFAQPPGKPGADPHHPSATVDTQDVGPGMMGMVQMMSGMNCSMMGGYQRGRWPFLKRN